MIHNFDILKWLTEHSNSVKETEREITFTNISGTGSSLIKPTKNQILLQINNPNLSTFYDHFLGGHFDNSQLMIPTIIKGGFEIGGRWHLPDIIEARVRASELGINIPEDEDIIVIEAGWMFFHTISSSVPAKIKMYDRDYATVHEEDDIASVFEKSWKILEADH